MMKSIFCGIIYPECEKPQVLKITYGYWCYVQTKTVNRKKKSTRLIQNPGFENRSIGDEGEVL